MDTKKEKYAGDRVAIADPKCIYTQLIVPEGVRKGWLRKKTTKRFIEAL